MEPYTRCLRCNALGRIGKQQATSFPSDQRDKLGSFSNDDGIGNEDVTSKYKFALL